MLFFSLFSLLENESRVFTLSYFPFCVSFFESESSYFESLSSPSWSEFAIFLCHPSRVYGYAPHAWILFPFCLLIKGSRRQGSYFLLFASVYAPETVPGTQYAVNKCYKKLN